MRFIDEARVYVQAGKGGDGAIAFLREKFRPFGGPAGGDGGRGGDVIFEVDEGLTTLLDFKFKPRLVARDGEPGRGKQQYGHNGSDLIVRVPPGTIAFDEDSGEPIADLVMPKARAIVAHGGRGGFGNMHFVSSTRRAPRIATPGEKGEQRWLRLELRLVAEAGLSGCRMLGNPRSWVRSVGRVPRLLRIHLRRSLLTLAASKSRTMKHSALPTFPDSSRGRTKGMGSGLSSCVILSARGCSSMS